MFDYVCECESVREGGKVTASGPDDKADLRLHLSQIAREMDRIGPTAETLTAKADLLVQLGEPDAARLAYLAALQIDETHLFALNNFGALAEAGGFISAATTLYAQAANAHPKDAASKVNLASALLRLGQLDAAEATLDQALAADPHFAPAHRARARLLSRQGEARLARESLKCGFADQAVFPPTDGRPPSGRPRVLKLISGLEADTPLDPILDPDRFHVTALAAEFFDLNSPPPPHDVIWNAIAEADLCAEGLSAAQTCLEAWGAVAINPPEKVRLTGRCETAQRLGALVGVVTAPILALTKPDLLAGPANPCLLKLGETGSRLSFPLAIRTRGLHFGQAFERVETADELIQTVARLPGDDLFVMAFLDTRGEDGLYRKYRMMSVAGQLLPVHLARSRHWKVHLANAEESAGEAHAQEEERFLTDPAAALGQPAFEALRRIQAAVSLDYFGMDFALTPSGQVVLFEANAAMAVPLTGNAPRDEAARLIQAAARQMIHGRRQSDLRPSR